MKELYSFHPYAFQVLTMVYPKTYPKTSLLNHMTQSLQNEFCALDFYEDFVEWLSTWVCPVLPREEPQVMHFEGRMAQK